MIQKIPRIIAVGVLTSYIFVLGVCSNKQETNVVDAQIRIEKMDIVMTESKIKTQNPANKRKKTVVKNKKVYTTGWTTTSVNVRKGPSIDSDILETYSFNKKIRYAKHSKEWVEIKFKGKTAYMSKKYISKKKRTYREYDVPRTSGFKSYMSYKCITSTSSPQYKLQKDKAYTGKYGIRQVDGRFCVAIGSHFTSKIGTLFDLVLVNGTVIPCILSDQKSDKDTDSQNIITEHNGCLSEFIVNTNVLTKSAKQQGDISYCNKKWNSPVKSIRVYE